MAENWTRGLEGNHANHYITIACPAHKKPTLDEF